MDIDKTLSRSSASKSDCASKTQFFKTKAGKCHRPGPVLRNPYLNFLREFRKRNCGLSAVEVIRRGAKEWKTMPKETKLQYIEEAFYAPKKRRPTIPIPIDAGCCPKILCPSAKKKKKRSGGCKKSQKRKKAKKRKCGKKRRPKKKARCGKSKKKRSKPKKKKNICNF